MSAQSFNKAAKQHTKAQFAKLAFMRFRVRSIFLVITILAVAVSLFDFSSLRYHPIQEHQYPTEYRTGPYKIKLNESSSPFRKRTIYYGTRDPKRKGDSRQLTYVVITDAAKDFNHKVARKLARRIPRRQLHQILNRKHTSSSRSISWPDFEELHAMEPHNYDIEALVRYADRRKHWRTKGLDLTASGYWGGTSFDAHNRMCKQAFSRDRKEVLAWLNDYPVKQTASSNFGLVNADELSFEKSVWLLDQLEDDPAYAEAYKAVGQLHSLGDRGVPRTPFLEWALNLPQPDLRRSALTGMMYRLSEWSNSEAFQFALKNLAPDDFDEVDKLCEQGVPPEQVAHAFTWWSARDRFIHNEPYNETSTVAFNSASVGGIHAALQIEDTELVDNVLPDMFRGWEWYAREENQQSELNELTQLWKTLPIYRQLGTLEPLLEAIAKLQPDDVPYFVADLEDVRLAEAAETIAQDRRTQTSPP